MNLSPLHDRVVIEKIEEEKKTSGGVIIPDTAQEKPQKGRVIATGPGVHNDNGNVIPLTVKANDMVLFGKWSGTEIEVAGKEYLIMKESDIFAIIK